MRIGYIATDEQMNAFVHGELLHVRVGCYANVVTSVKVQVWMMGYMFSDMPHFYDASFGNAGCHEI
jgi:hypothetical protein